MINNPGPLMLWHNIKGPEALIFLSLLSGSGSGRGDVGCSR
jgi:hypothetical protein